MADNKREEFGTPDEIASRRASAVLVENMTMRERSGRKEHASPYVSLFYELVRDHVQPGVLETLVRNVTEEPSRRNYTNGWLASYAEDLVERMEVGRDKDIVDQIWRCHRHYTQLVRDNPNGPEHQHFKTAIVALLKGTTP